MRSRWAGVVVHLEADDALVEFSDDEDIWETWVPLEAIPEQLRTIGSRCSFEWSSSTWTQEDIARINARADEVARLFGFEDVKP